MAKKTVTYYLDETDQIEVDGHTLSRLYLGEPVRDAFTNPGYAVFGEDNSNRKMGGYVESLSNLSNTVDYLDKPAWVMADSMVYGNSKLGSGACIYNSTIKDSKVQCYKLTGTNVYDSHVTNSTIGAVRGSTIVNSNCTRFVYNSDIYNSNLKLETYNSTIRDSQIAGSKQACIKNANLTNVNHHGSIAGTFSDIEQGDISTHTLNASDIYGYYTPLILLEGPDEHFALSVNHVGNVKLSSGVQLAHGDVNIDELHDLLTQEIDGKTVGKQSALQKLAEIKDRIVLTDSDLDFGDELSR